MPINMKSGINQWMIIFPHFKRRIVGRLRIFQKAKDPLELNDSGEDDEYKAHLVVKGYKQQYDVD